MRCRAKSGYFRLSHRVFFQSWSVNARLSEPAKTSLLFSADWTNLAKRREQPRRY
ncbi:hypothetical protein IG631_00925 [Alternaria alternata]|nr:hypothetical protein IG631_00925 [Alternaria alternata]